VDNPILISTAAYDGYDLSVVLGEISKLQVHLVELAFIAGYTDPFTEDAFSASNANVISKLLADCDLKCLSLSSHIDLSQEKAVDIFKKRMDFAKMVGARYIVSNAGPRQRVTEFMRNIESLAKLASSLELTIALENAGDGKPNIIDTGESGASLAKKIGSDWVKLNYDFGNLISHCFEKLRPEEDFRHALPFTAHYHIKDVAADPTGWHFTEIGKGVIEYSSILKELASGQKSKPLSLEIPLRVTRSLDASPRRANKRVDLKHIRRIMEGSLDFVTRALSS
jgi:sugar phosphate isomerase/epimerase